MDRDVDRAAVLIARNRLLLTQAEEARAWSREAQEQSKNAVQNMMEIRLAWALVRQRRNDPHPDPHQRPGFDVSLNVEFWKRVTKGGAS